MRAGRLGGITVAAAIAAALLAACGDEPKAQSAGTAGAGDTSPSGVTVAPTSPEADPAAIVADLWKRRQAGMLTEDAAVFEDVDTGALKPHDLFAADLVACGCDVPRRQSPLDRVVVLRAEQPTPNVLFAEVFAHAPNGTTNRFWVIAQKVDTSWRLALVTDDEYDILGVHRLIDPTTTAPPTTPQDRQDGAAILQREVAESLRWLQTGQPMSSLFTGSLLRKRLVPGQPHGDRAKTAYGADAVASMQLRRQDPVFTFRLDAERVMTCGAIHVPTTVTAPAGQVLVQPSDQRAWGPELAAGQYDTVTNDTQTLTCVLDHGPSARPRYESVGNYHADIDTTGHPAG